MGGGTSRARAKAQPKSQPAVPPTAVSREAVGPTPGSAAGGGIAEEPTDYYLDHLDEVSDSGGDDDGSPDNRESWAMVSASLGMDGDELLFNMLYFGDGNAPSLGSAINSAMEETVALHSANNTPYKLRPAAAQDVEQLSQLEYDSALSPRAANNLRDCSVCKEDLEEGSIIIKLPRCAHVFHAECLQRWLLYQSWCPVCRTEVGSSATSGAAQEQAQEQGQEQGQEHCEVCAVPGKGCVHTASKGGVGACLLEDTDDASNGPSPHSHSLPRRLLDAGTDDSGEEEERKDRN